MVCEPEYYVWQYAQPNWCLYNTDDEVAVHYAFTPSFHIDSWYVTPSYDSGRDGEYVVTNTGSMCYITMYPW